MPTTQVTQEHTSKSSTPSAVQQKSSAMVLTGQKPAEPVVAPGKTDPNQVSKNLQAKGNPNTKRPADAGRVQKSINPVGSNQSRGMNEQEKDTRQAATLNEAVAAGE